MFKPGQELFIDFGGTKQQRVLHAAIAGEHAAGANRFTFVESDLMTTSPAPGSSVTVFFNGADEFMQQPAEIVGMEAVDDLPPVGIRLIGEAVSAETRKCFRVSTALANYHADLGRLGRRRLVDVSATGVAFITPEQLTLGDAVDLTIEVGGRRFEGRGFVQSVKEVRQGYRYGVLCSNTGTGLIQKGLQQLTMDAQRSQLRRLSGAA